MNMPNNRPTWKIILPFLLLMTLAACTDDTSQPPADDPADTTAMAAPDDAAPQAGPTTRLNINEATEEELRTIPNVGDQMVHEFFEYRPYISIQQFRQEIGKYVDEAQVQAYEAYIYVPVDPNESDAATLQQLPGVDAAVAEALIAGRPYASQAAFLDTLGTRVSADERSAASMYLVAE